MLQRFASDGRGTAAAEFALIVPVLAAVIVVGFDGWAHLRLAGDAQTALQSGARVYAAGGADDAAAKQVALDAWPNRPVGSSLDITRACLCSEDFAACGTLCDDGQPPSIEITLAAEAPFEGSTFSRTVRQTDVLRVR